MPTRLKLRYYGDPVLRKVAKPVKEVGPGERLFIKEMIQAMYEFEGSGLAAPQVGVDQQIFVADAGEGPFVVINPQITKLPSRETVLEEGCLSLPGVRIHVKRPETIRVQYFNEYGQALEREMTGLMAKIFQHETDHLLGRMVIDYATKAERERFKDQLAKLEALSQKPILPRKPRG